MSDLIIAHIAGYVINVGDISTVAPSTDYIPGVAEGTKGSKVTFMSKATSIFIPDMTPEQFMDALVIDSIRLDPPN